jgi:hypothetical protein
MEIDHDRGQHGRSNPQLLRSKKKNFFFGTLPPKCTMGIFHVGIGHNTNAVDEASPQVCLWI